MIYGQTINSDRQNDEGVNANASSITTSLDMNDARYIGLFVKGVSGLHHTHVTTIQVYDGSNWWDLNHSIIGEGQLHEELCIGEKVRAKITTVEGTPSVVDITLIIK